MKIVAAGLAALFITVSPLAQLAQASEYKGGAKYGPLPGQVFGHHHRGAKGAGGGAYAAHREAASNHARHRGSQNRPSPGVEDHPQRSPADIKGH